MLLIDTFFLTLPNMHYLKSRINNINKKISIYQEWVTSVIHAYSRNLHKNNR